MKFWIILAVLPFLMSLPPASAAPAKAAPAAKSAPKSQPAPASSALNSYAAQLRQKMGANWNYPNGHNSVTLTVKVNQDGSVQDLNLSSSPKNDEAEQKANDALNSAQPLAALPSGVTAANISCVFDSHTDPNGQDCKASISVKIDPVKAAAASEQGAENSEKKE